MSEYDIIPELTKETLDRYVNDKVATGGFLYSVLTNDLFGAVGKADEGNSVALRAIVRYIYNELPASCWGSPAAVRDWLAQKRPAVPGMKSRPTAIRPTAFDAPPDVSGMKSRPRPIPPIIDETTRHSRLLD